MIPDEIIKLRQMSNPVLLDEYIQSVKAEANDDNSYCLNMKAEILRRMNWFGTENTRLHARLREKEAVIEVLKDIIKEDK